MRNEAYGNETSKNVQLGESVRQQIIGTTQRTVPDPMKPTKWKLLYSRSLRKFRVVDVLENTYQFLPTQEKRSYLVCDSADWVLVIAITPDDQVVFVRQFRHGLGQMVLEIPGGIMDPGEQAADTAARELREETGFVAESIQVLGPLLPNPALNNARVHVALATGCVARFPASPEPFEDIQVELRPLADVGNMMASGELQHALCIAAFSISGLLNSNAGDQ